MSHVDIPQLPVPFYVAERGVVPYVEQDTIADIAQCVFAILATEEGSRLEDPDFGLADQSFQRDGIDLEEMREAIFEWEPRVNDVLEDVEWEDVVQRVRVMVAASGD